MPIFNTEYFGPVEYSDDTVLEFPRGLPGFDERRKFLAIQQTDTAPLLFLQSLEDARLCFPTLPILAVDPTYRLQVCDEDLDAIGFPVRHQPGIGVDTMCLTVVSIRESGPTANLLAPIVVNLGLRKAVQAVAVDSEYSHQHALLAEEAPVCS
jgi:flagellar assembly factor FliW